MQNRKKFLNFEAVLCVFSGPLLAAFLSSHALANQNPYLNFIEDQSTSVGESLEFLVHPVDPDGVVPGVFTMDLPLGAQFLDNGDGRRRFVWTPSDTQAGDHTIIFVTVDASDPSLRHSQAVTVRVAANEPEPIAPVAPANPPTPNAELNLPPVIEELQPVTVTPGELVQVRIVPRDPEGWVPGLNAHAMPAGAEFVDNFDGTRNFNWSPTDAQIGRHVMVFVAVDPMDSNLRSQQELTVDVVANLGAPIEQPPQSPQQPQQPEPEQPQPEPIAQPEIPRPQPIPGVNSAPYFEALDNQVVALGQTLSMIIAPRDPDGDVPGMYAHRLPHNASLGDNFDGTRTLRWRPFPVNEGDTWITFTAIDSRDSSLTTTQSVKITVADLGNYNFEPVINGINNPVVRAGDTLNQLVQPVDPDGDVPRLSVLNPPEGAEFVDNFDGTRTLRWRTDYADITERDGIDNPHIINFRAVDARDENLSDDHELKVSVIDPGSIQRSGERLRTLAERRGFLIGFAAMLKSSSLADWELYREIAKQEFNIVTPENSHKWGWIQPERGEFDFEDADELLDYAERNGMLMHGHPMIWHRQLPAWVQQLELPEVEQVMFDHIDALGGRYRGRMAMWDVVNEAIEDDATFRQSIWYEAMGRDFISKAYHRARAADPESILIYNDYDVGWKNDKSDLMYQMLSEELQRGTPIDAVGFQMHVWTQFDAFQSVEDNFQRFANLGLDIYITELDVAVTATGQEQLQASVYERIARICLEQPRCKGLQAWGFTDRYSWRYNFKPLLFTERYQAKPSYYALQRALQ